MSLESQVETAVQSAVGLAQRLRTEFAGHSVVEDIHTVLTDLLHLVGAPPPGEAPPESSPPPPPLPPA